VTVDQILPWGAKVRPWHADVRGLAEYAFAGLDTAFAARAIRDQGGFVVAGVAFGTGGCRSQAAIVMTQLGIRAVLARSFAPSFRKQLVLHGLLPLRFATPGDYDHVRQRDELEIPDLPEGLEPHKPLVVRNLTRGTQYTVRHELAARELVTVRAGGLLRARVPAVGGATA
jgi:aconitate hydratase